MAETRKAVQFGRITRSVFRVKNKGNSLSALCRENYRGAENCVQLFTHLESLISKIIAQRWKVSHSKQLLYRRIKVPDGKQSFLLTCFDPPNVSVYPDLAADTSEQGYSCHSLLRLWYCRGITDGMLPAIEERVLRMSPATKSREVRGRKRNLNNMEILKFHECD
jgi:hypothetical protein